MNNQDKKYLRYFFLFWGISAVVMTMAIVAIDISAEFAPLESGTAIHDRVSDVSEHAARSVRYVEFEGGQKILISRGTVNFENDPTDLIHFLAASDFVEKDPGNDTIVITRSNLSITKPSRHVFVLNRQINTKLDSGQMF